MKVRVYSTTTCPYCVKAKAWLNDHNVPFEEVSLNDKAARSAFKEQHPELKTVPQIFVLDDDGNEARHIGGYDDLAAKGLE